MKMSSSSLSSSKAVSSFSPSHPKPRRFNTTILVILLAILNVLHIRYMAPSPSWSNGSSSSMSFQKKIGQSPNASLALPPSRLSQKQNDPWNGDHFMADSDTTHSNTFGRNTSTDRDSPKSDDHDDDDDRSLVTIIITSSWVPSHPSLDLIRPTIESLSYLKGLSLNKTRILITVDSVIEKQESQQAEEEEEADQDTTIDPTTARRRLAGKPTVARKAKVLAQYVYNLHQTYKDWTNLEIWAPKYRLNLVGNVQRAMKEVDTEFVYVLQHDMPFIAPIDHSALIRTFQECPTDGIDNSNNKSKMVRLVRFSPRTTLIRRRDNRGFCGDDLDLEANGIFLTKTHTWSDNNHLTRKSYYEEMFETIDGWDKVKFMETIMNPLGEQNCSHWGTYLYGKRGEGRPTIVHLDGRRRSANHHSEKSS